MIKPTEDRNDQSNSGPWDQRVHFSPSTHGRSFAYRPGELITLSTSLPQLRRLAISWDSVEPGGTDELEVGTLVRLTGIGDPIGAARALRSGGFISRPNHVLFAAAMAEGSPVGWGSPVGSGQCQCCAPGCRDPFAGGAHQRTGPTRTTAHPVVAPMSLPQPPAVKVPCRVLVLDTGYAPSPWRSAAANGPYIGAVDVEHIDTDGDHFLDPCQGHSTFIAGILARLAPGVVVDVREVTKAFGDTDDWTVAIALDAAFPDPEQPSYSIVNMSFAGYCEDDDPPIAIAAAIERILKPGRRDPSKSVAVVAAAGNDATCRPAWPAAFEDVVGVAALSPSGPAPFTNYGPWITACAPGCDIISTFLQTPGVGVPGAGGDSDLLQQTGWARWSGTSFAAPAVGARIAREMMSTGQDCATVIRRVIHGAALARLPLLGTIVNDA